MLKPPNIGQAQKNIIAALLCLAFGIGVFDSQSLRHSPAKINTADNTQHSSAVQTTEKSPNITDWLLVLFNGLLVGSTALLWRANNRSATIAERALTELEAPFIAVKIIKPGIEFKNLLTINFSDLEFSFVNYGRTPAYIMDFVERITPVQAGARLPPPVDSIKERGEPMPYGVIAPPNDMTQIFHTPSNFDFSLGAEGGIVGLKVTQRPYFRGYVRYADIFSNVYVLGFSFVFDTQRSAGS
jgi:hypothetical protein